MVGDNVLALDPDGTKLTEGVGVTSLVGPIDVVDEVVSETLLGA